MIRQVRLNVTLLPACYCSYAHNWQRKALLFRGTQAGECANARHRMLDLGRQSRGATRKTAGVLAVGGETCLETSDGRMQISRAGGPPVISSSTAATGIMIRMGGWASSHHGSPGMGPKLGGGMRLFEMPS
jgi:hypothetical protein